MKFLSSKISNKIFFTSLLTLNATLLILGAINYYQQKHLVERSALAKIRGIATTLALQIDGETHRRIAETYVSKDQINDKFIPPEFSTLQHILAQVVESNNLGTPIYTLTLSSKQKGKILANPNSLIQSGTEFILMSTPNPFYRHSYLYKPEMKDVFFHEKVVETTPYHDENGDWISVYAPIKNTKGKTEAALEVDLKMTDLYAANKKVLYHNLIFMAFLSLVSAIISLLVTHRIVKPIRKLTLDAERLGQGNYTSIITTTALDEVGKLASVLEKSRAEIADFIHRILDSVPALMLSFNQSGVIQPHTSSLTTTAFGKSLSGLSVNDTLLSGHDSIDPIIAMVADPNVTIDFKSLFELAPSEITIQDTEFRLNYKQIIKDGSFEQVFVLGIDVTQENRFKRKIDENHRHNVMLFGLIKQRSLFENYYQESITEITRVLEILAGGTVNNQDIHYMFRVIHTVKGSGASLGLDELAEASHQLESILSSAREQGVLGDIYEDVKVRTQQVLNILEEIHEELNVVMGAKDPQVKIIEQYEIDQIKFAIEKSDDVKAYELLDNLDEISLQRYLKPKVESVIQSASEATGKEVNIQFEIESGRIPEVTIRILDSVIPHLIRNAVDHGIETEEIRMEQGKTAMGTITIKAKKLRKQLWVQIQDDGKGMDPEVIEKKAIEKGLFTPDQTTGFSREKKMAIIFMPGFTTAATVSSISGRGVGMDAVYQKITISQGSIEIDSMVGQGSTFTLILPLL